jgi:hypothetical protein
MSDPFQHYAPDLTVMRPQVIMRATVLYDFKALTPIQISIRAGTTIDVIQYTGGGGWSFGEVIESHVYI